MKVFFILFNIMISLYYINTGYCCTTKARYLKTSGNVSIKCQMKSNAALMRVFKPGTTEDLDIRASIVFRYLFQRKLNGNNREIPGLPVIQKNHDSISDADYEAMFKHEKSATISKEEENASIMLIDSICAYYGISTKNLIKIRHSKRPIGRKDIEIEEVNELFDNCLKMINEKFVKPTTFDENKLAELIAKKLIEKQNESTMSTVPDCPPLI